MTAIAATAVSMLMLQTPALADTTLVDLSLPFALGGAQVCVAGNCVPPVAGITNTHLSAVLRGSGVSPPALTTGTAPGCTANLNLAVFVTTPGVGATLHTEISFDRTDMNGHVIRGSHEVIAKDVPVGLAGQAIPLVSLCAAIL